MTKKRKTKSNQTKESDISLNEHQLTHSLLQTHLEILNDLSSSSVGHGIDHIKKVISETREQRRDNFFKLFDKLLFLSDSEPIDLKNILNHILANDKSSVHQQLKTSEFNNNIQIINEAVSRACREKKDVKSNRYTVIGFSGQGKTTFAEAIARSLGIFGMARPTHSKENPILDKMKWQETIKSVSETYEAGKYTDQDIKQASEYITESLEKVLGKRLHNIQAPNNNIDYETLARYIEAITTIFCGLPSSRLNAAPRKLVTFLLGCIISAWISTLISQPQIVNHLYFNYPFEYREIRKVVRESTLKSVRNDMNLRIVDVKTFLRVRESFKPKSPVIYRLKPLSIVCIIKTRGKMVLIEYVAPNSEATITGWVAKKYLAKLK